MSKKSDVTRSVAQTVMLTVGCNPVVSQGFEEGKTYCQKHGTPNDICWGWSKQHGCLFVHGVVKSARDGDGAALAEMLHWAVQS